MKKKFLFFFLILIVSNSALAMKASYWTPTILYGVGTTHAAQTQTLRLANTPDPGLENRYVGESMLNGATILGFALEREVKSIWHGTTSRLGVEFDYLRNNSVKGTVEPMVNVAPDFDQLNYVYNIQTYFLQATGKLIKRLHSKLDGYLQLGIGAAGNRLSAYQEYPSIGSSAAPMLSPFQNNTTYNPAFSLGFGAIFQITQFIGLSLNYRYIYAGKGQFGKSNVEQTNAAISLSPISYQFLILGLSL